MRTLYLHGLDSYPIPEKKQIMKDAGLDVTALHFNYREELGIFETIKDTALRKNIEFIIGSSLGGYLGNVLAEDLGLPCLLFNPAMHYTDVFYSKIPKVDKPKCPTRYVVLGLHDETINPNYTVKVLREKGCKNSMQRVLTAHWLGHEIDLRTFKEMVNWAVSSLKNNS